MSTYLEMRERIADEVDDGDIDTQIGRAILTAIRFYERTRFWFNQKTFTFATVAAQEEYSVSDAADIATFLEVKSAYITSSGIRYPFPQVDYEVLDAAQNGAITGRPTNWAYFAQKIRPFPIPDAAYTATISAHYRLTELSADGDTNVWTTEAEELIRQRAKKILAIDITKEPMDSVGADALETAALEGLLRETALRRGRPLLMVDPALITAMPYDIRTG
jgi:hypothetical protein